VSETRRTLPDYEFPPIFETVLGVRFSPLTPFNSRLLSRYWTSISKEYPHFEIQDPIPQMTEEFGAPRPRAPGIQIIKGPEFRCWFIDETETRLIQLQRDGFFLNWRKVKENEPYLHYEHTRPTFEKYWQSFRGFLNHQGLTETEVVQCEVTYINHIEKSQEWNSYAELNKVISCWSGKYSGDFLPDPESVSVNAQYVMPDQKGRLHIALFPAIRKKDAKEILQLNLTARGKPASSKLDDIVAWLDLGHEWVVKGFTDFTAKEMHQFWRRTV
jgi:uncharacterized protein (TIGR04255 family)